MLNIPHSGDASRRYREIISETQGNLFGKDISNDEHHLIVTRKNQMLGLIETGWFNFVFRTPEQRIEYYGHLRKFYAPDKVKKILEITIEKIRAIEPESLSLLREGEYLPHGDSLENTKNDIVTDIETALGTVSRKRRHEGEGGRKRRSIKKRVSTRRGGSKKMRTKRRYRKKRV